ncbi:MAG: TDT family transporter, partial [Turicibacter sp.]
MNHLFKKIENLPVGVIATAVGAATLANAYLPFGFTWIRHLTLFLVSFVWLAAIIKVTYYFTTFKKEYSNVVPASLYATFSMLTMIIGSYIFTYQPMVGKLLWLAGIVIHVTHILIFTYRNVIKGVKIDTFLPTWFVTYNGLLVSTVVGGAMNEPQLSKIIVIYGIIVFLTILPFKLYRLVTKPLPEMLTPTLCILLAPSSLCLVSYLNVFSEPNKIIVIGLYVIILLTLLTILINS